MGGGLRVRGSLALRRKFSASQFLPDIRRYGATYANYVGKPLSYVLATPEHARRCRQSAARGLRQRGRTRRRREVRPPVQHAGDGRIRFNRGRYRDRPHSGHPAGIAGPAARRDRDPRCRDRRAVPAGRDGRTGQRLRRRAVRGILQRPGGRCRADARRGVPQRRSGLPRREQLRVLRGPAWRLDAGRRREPRTRRRSSGCCCAIPMSSRWRCTEYRRPTSAIR